MSKSEPSASRTFVLPLFEVLAAAWFFAFGAVIGSFLNVVVWRTPRGESIVGPSRCPQCRTAIRWYNNVPVFGWLWLGGKCRDCRLPISPRYPIVEFICGAMFLAVALAELADRGFTDIILDAHWDYIFTYCVHLLLTCALFAWALMQVDEQKVPPNQILWLWLIGLVLALLQPSADGTAATVHPAHLELKRALRGLSQAASGFLLGGFLGFLIGGVAWWTRRAQGWLVIGAALASVGLFLGVAAALQITVVALGLRALSLLFAWPFQSLRGVPFTMDIFVASVAYCCLHDTAAWAALALRLYIY